MKLHSDDYDHARLLPGALYWVAYLWNGRGQKYQERDLPSYAVARGRADALAAQHGTHGRKGLVYAIMPGNFTVECSPEVMLAVEELEIKL